MNRLMTGLLAGALLACGAVSSFAKLVDGPDCVEKLVFKTDQAKVTTDHDGSITFVSDPKVAGTAISPLRGIYRGKVVMEATIQQKTGIENPNFTIALGSKDGMMVGGGEQFGEARAWIVESVPRKELITKGGAPYVAGMNAHIRIELDLVAKKAVFMVNDFRLEAPFTVDLKQVDTIQLTSYVQGFVLHEVVISADSVERVKTPAKKKAN